MLFVHQNQRRGAGCPLGLIALLILIVLLPARAVQAAPTQDDVFKSIQSNVNDSVDSKKVLAVMLAIGGAITLLAVLSHRQQMAESIPKPLNSQGKLLRELMKTAGLKSAHIRQLKSLRNDLEKADIKVEHLTTLLLCPSLIRRARDQDDTGIT